MKRAGRDKIQSVPDRIIVLKNAGAAAQAADEANFRIKYAEVLNAAQLAAVTHRNGPLLVVAGAGSGKTRTLIYRVAGLRDRSEPAMLGVGLPWGGADPRLPLPAFHFLSPPPFFHALRSPTIRPFLLPDALARDRDEITASKASIPGCRC